MFKIILQLHGGGGKGKGGGGGGSSTSGYTNIDIDTTKTTDPFSSKASRKNYNQFLNQTKQNYDNTMKYQPLMLKGLLQANNFISQSLKKGKLGDDSYFKQAWGQAQGIDLGNLQKLNSQSFNPNDNADWVSANDMIDENARLGWGKYNNQLMQNMIGSNMANGSGHQTAAARMSAILNSQLAADRANRWQQQYNQNVQSSMAANKQLSDFYNTLSNIGLDYTKLSSQDLSTLLNAYQNQTNAYGNIFDAANNALKTQGQAVAMGSDPKETSHTHKEGVESQSTQQQSSGWDTFGNVLGAAATAGRFFGW